MLALVVLFLPLAIASHFRGGIISARPEEGGVTNRTMEVTFYVSYRKNHIYAGKCNEKKVLSRQIIGTHPEDQSIFCVSGCRKKTKVTRIRYTCTDFSISGNWEFGEHTVTFTFPQDAEESVTLSAKGCCWVSPFGKGAWDLFVRMDLFVRDDTGRINASPRARFLPVTKIQSGCNHTITIRPYDPDGDVVRCRWGNKTTTPVECAGICDGFKGAILDSETCTLTYSSPSGDRGYKAVAIMLEDFARDDTNFTRPLSTVSMNFLVEVFQTKEACAERIPEFLRPTPHNGACFGVPPNTNYSGNITVDGKGNPILEVKTVSPIGTTKSAVTALTSPDLYGVSILWNPVRAQYYENNNNIETLCFTAISTNDRQSEQRCVQLMAGVLPPRQKPGSHVPRNTKVYPSNTTFTILFDQPIVRSNMPAKIRFFNKGTNVEVNSIEIDKAVNISAVDTAQKSLTFTPMYTFTEKEMFSITLDPGVVSGTVGCGANNEAIEDADFWTFETLDVTPPMVTFVKAPSRTNGEVTLTWVFDEEVKSVACMLATPALGGNQTCSNTTWTGQDLRQGSHVLSIRAVDLAGNTAERRHSWVVDLVPPVVSINPSFKGNITNQRSPRFTLYCIDKHSCHFECLFIINELNEVRQVPCRRGRWTAPALVNGYTYTIVARATDDVGNQGRNFSFIWNADFESPVISRTLPLQRPCDGNLSVDVLGIPSVRDNLDANPAMTYSDTVGTQGCMRERHWTATDAAGNVGKGLQTIVLTRTPIISHVSPYRLACDDGQRIQLPPDTASVDNICGRPVTLISSDSLRTPVCPSRIERTWTAQDTCNSSALPVTVVQQIDIYRLCPVNSCGRRENPPHGVCISEKCSCFTPWYGDNCDVLIRKPVIQNVSNVVLREGEQYELFLDLTQGSQPIFWTLIVSPPLAKCSSETGRITWEASVSNQKTFVVQAANIAGASNVSWSVSVTPGYETFLKPLPMFLYVTPSPVKLSGYVTHKPNSLLRGNKVQVHVIIEHNSTSRLLQTYTDRDGLFQVTFTPLPREYGSYEAYSVHPGIGRSDPQVRWNISGMSIADTIVKLHTTVTGTGAVEREFLNVTFLTNNGPVALSNLQVINMYGVSPGVSMEILMDGKPSVKSLALGDKVAIDILVSAPTTSIPIRVLVTIQSEEGTSVGFFIHIEFTLLRPKIMLHPVSLVTSMARGSQRVIDVDVGNVGGTTARDVRLVLPRSPIISVVAFGNSTHGSLDLQVNKSETLAIQITIPGNHTLGRIIGSVALETSNAKVQLPFVISVISNEKSAVTFRVEDEFTYFADGKPLLSTASVRIQNYRRGIVIIKTTEEGSGSVTFEDISEDTYEVWITAPGHQSVKGVYAIPAGNSNITAFLKRNAVKYTWTVTPTEVQDTYKVELTADFETNVPMPVVTVTPNAIDLEQYELGLKRSLEFNITNHGLIRVERVSIAFPLNHPRLQFSAPTEVPTELEARTSIIVPVHVAEKSVRRGKRASCGDHRITIHFGYKCGDWVLKQIAVVLRAPVSECHALAFRPRSGPGGSGYITLRGARISGIATCNPCLQAAIDCLWGFLPLPSIPCILTGIGALGGEPDISNHIALLKCVLENIPRKANPFTRPKQLFDCALGLLQNCPVGGGQQGGRRKRRDVRNEILGGFAIAFAGIAEVSKWKLEVFGKQVWLTADDGVWIEHVLTPAISDRSDLGHLISTRELRAITARQPPGGVTSNDVTDLLMRWNNTIHAWNKGQLEPKMAAHNFASYSKVRESELNIRKAQKNAREHGYDSFVEFYNTEVAKLNEIDDWTEERGVCAVVRVRIDQEIALTREGFLATLELDNGEVSPLKRIDVTLRIRDAETGTHSTQLFSVNNGTVSGAIGKDRTLDVGRDGSIEWLIIPYSEAAPKSDRYYDVGGTLFYDVDGLQVSVPLFPARIMVRPDPRLIVHYFWQKFIISDDPFTEEVEQAVPFVLGVIVRNAGFGIARNLHIASGQPEIIENEKGLLVTFRIIGTTLDHNEVMPSLNVDLGDIGPNVSVAAQWWMVSSLKGIFSNYSTTFEYSNPVGDPKLSILDELVIHDLIHLVRITDVEPENGVLDYLVNDQVDFKIHPDALYSTRSLERYNVMYANISTINRMTNGTMTTWFIQATPQATGFIYYRFTTDIITTESVSINSAFFIREFLGREQVTLPRENAWFDSWVGDRSSKYLVGHMLVYIKEPGVPQTFIVYLGADLTSERVTLRLYKTSAIEKTTPNPVVPKSRATPRFRCMNLFWIIAFFMQLVLLI